MTPSTNWIQEDFLLAKSADHGGQTLAQHTWDVLERLSDQVRLRPHLPDMMDDPRLWHRMFWGCFLHDFGKAAQGFQDVLRGNPGRWAEQRHRHEVLSLAFVDWLFPPGHADRSWVIAVIVCHHKDANDERLTHYGGHKQLKDMQDDERELMKEWLEYLASQIDPEVKRHLWRWLHDLPGILADELHIPLQEAPVLIDLDAALRRDMKRDIHNALREFYEWYKRLSPQQRLYAHLARGLILTADHAGSAEVGRFPDMPPDLGRAVDDLLKDLEPRQTQTAMRATPPGSTILTAPTGSGKTEAALLWAARQMAHQPAPRLFYTLPYQASMNAMAERLSKALFGKPLAAETNDMVAIQHSRATLKYYQEMMEADDSDPLKTSQEARRRRDQARLNYYPIQIFSPYQMLKAAFQLKGYEALLVDYTGALFIFDEIHAYEAKRLAQVIETMRWLREHFAARFLVMTATLPPMICKRLAEALGDPEQIEADAELYEQSQRHTVHLLEGDLLEQLDRPLADWRDGQSVLVCCNTVARAQQAYDAIKRALEAEGLAPHEHVMLLHGRFNGSDRHAKEAQLMQWAGVGSTTRQRCIIVATQVVEVSLNIDLDTLYTDPAPLEALLQRFGRVNRGRKTRELRPVHVFRAPLGKDESKPYDHRLVEAGLQVLGERDGQAIDEAQVGAMLDRVYDGALRAAWEQDYADAAKGFRGILDEMIPFQSADADLWQKFYKMFDGVQALPAACQGDYDDAIEQRLYLEAMQYLVNMSWGQLKSLEQLALKAEEGYIYRLCDSVPYDSEYGLNIAEARRKLKGVPEDDDV